MSINSDMNQAIIDLDTAVQQHAMASSPYPVDRAPMHETDGSTCQCFKPKETGDAARQQG